MAKICIVLAILCSTAVNMENLDVSTKNPTTTEQDTYSAMPMEDVSTAPHAQRYTRSSHQQNISTSTALSLTPLIAQLYIDPVKICEQKCDNYCVECREPVRCVTGQKNCGKNLSIH